MLERAILWMEMEQASYEAPASGEVFPKCPGKGKLLTIKKVGSAATGMGVQVLHVHSYKGIFARYHSLALSP